MKKQNLSSVLRHLPEIIPEAEAIPLFGNAPLFDWHQLSSLLGTRLELKGFSIHPASQSWASNHETKEQLGTGYFLTPLFLSPISPPFFFAISKSDKNKLTALIMEGKAKGQISEPLKEGFCRFLVLEAIAAASGIAPLSRLTPSLGEKQELPEENAFCIDVEISFEDNSCWSKLIIPSSFRKAWVEHFAAEPREYRETELAKTTELILDCQAGSVAMSPAEWEQLQEGDFVLLDRGNFDSETTSALCILKIGTTPLFHAKITENQMELIEYTFTNEENMERETEEESVSIKNLPMQINVELARLRISLDELMQLTPGNTLTLPIQPDQGVDLTVNGKKVGRAELLYLGESLGIRILELG